MIRRTLGAPCGGTTRAAQWGVDWLAGRLISPPNFGGGGGRYFPSIVVVAPGEPGVPVVCCARLVVPSAHSKQAAVSVSPQNKLRRLRLTGFELSSCWRVWVIASSLLE